jgi:hypothetical protein
MGHPVRTVVIEGAVARFFERAPKEFTTVQEAADIDKALGDPENAHHCPLCNNFFGTYAFMRHAKSCIDTYAPAWERQRDKAPPYELRRNTRKIFVGPELGTI